MSRVYEMSFTISDYNPDNRERLEEALEGLWELYDDSYDTESESGGPAFTMHGEANLTGGESEEEFFRRVAKALRAIDGGCGVEVTATYLENLPYEIHTLLPGAELEDA